MGLELLSLQGFPPSLLTDFTAEAEQAGFNADTLYGDLAGNCFSATVELSLKIAALAIIDVPPEECGTSSAASDCSSLDGAVDLLDAI